jgi:hypothetical protein
MLVCEKDGRFHVVRKIEKSGLGLKVHSYCKQDGFQGIDHFPEEFFPMFCEECQEKWEEAKSKAKK